MKEKLLTVGIPAYKAQSTICEALASIMIQTAKDNVSIIIANDYPGDDYSTPPKRKIHVRGDQDN